MRTGRKELCILCSSLPVGHFIDQHSSRMLDAFDWPGSTRQGFELSLSLQEDQLTSVARRSHVKDTNYEYSKVDT